MSRWRFKLVFAVFGISFSAFAASTSTGPTSDTEGKFLWENGKASFEKKDYADATRELQRFVDRYPGYPGYLEAHRLLGKSWIGAGHPEKAIVPLRYFVQDCGKDQASEQLQARIWLGEAYIGAHRYDEAFLVSLEAEKSKEGAQSVLPLFLKTNALIHLNKDKSAESVLAIAQKRLGTRKDPALLSEALFLRLWLNTRVCAKLGSEKIGDEGTVREQINRRGTCLLDSLLTFKEILMAQDPSESSKATEKMKEAYDDFAHACANPPRPTQLHPTPRNAQQLRSYRLELTAKLKQDCQGKYLDALDFLSTWKPKLPASTSRYVNAVTKELESHR